MAIALVSVAGMTIGSFFSLSFRERLLFAWPIGAGVGVVTDVFLLACFDTGFACGYRVAVDCPRRRTRREAHPSLFSKAAQGARGVFSFSTKYAANRAIALSYLELALVFVIVFQAVFSLVNLVALPIRGYDTWVIWF